MRLRNPRKLGAALESWLRHDGLVWECTAATWRYFFCGLLRILSAVVPLGGSTDVKSSFAGRDAAPLRREAEPLEAATLVVVAEFMSFFFWKAIGLPTASMFVLQGQKVKKGIIRAKSPLSLSRSSWWRNRSKDRPMMMQDHRAPVVRLSLDGGFAQLINTHAHQQNGGFCQCVRTYVLLPTQEPALGGMPSLLNPHHQPVGKQPLLSLGGRMTTKMADPLPVLDTDSLCPCLTGGEGCCSTLMETRRRPSRPGELLLPAYPCWTVGLSDPSSVAQVLSSPHAIW